MLIRLLNGSVGFLVIWLLILFTFAGMNPAEAEQLLSISWIKYLGYFITIVLATSAITNLVRVYTKEKNVSFIHFRNALVILAVGLLLVEWKNGWPLLRSLF